MCARSVSLHLGIPLSFPLLFKFLMLVLFLLLVLFFFHKCEPGLKAVSASEVHSCLRFPSLLWVHVNIKKLKYTSLERSLRQYLANQSRAKSNLFVSRKM